MKNLWFLLLAACLLFSCAKEEVHSSIQEVDQIEKDGISGKDIPTVKDGYLVFDCEKTMEDFIIGLADAEADPKQIEKIYKFRSYLNHVPETKINEGIFGDEYFAGVLNEDGMVAVGSYVFKLNPATQEVFVLDAGSSKGEIGQLSTASNANELSSKGLSFSFEDDVFEMLDDRANGCTVQAIFGCGEKCGFTQKHPRIRDYCTFEDGENEIKGFFDIHVRYWNGGIWHFANTKFEHACNSFNIDLLSDIRYTAKWKRKCRNEQNSSKDYQCTNVPTGFQLGCFPTTGNGLSKFKQRFYQGTRCLSKYHFKADGRIRSVCDDTDVIWTDFVEVIYGY